MSPEEEDERDEEAGHEERRVDSDGEPLGRQVEEGEVEGELEKPDERLALEEREDARLLDREAERDEAEEDEAEEAEEETPGLERAGVDGEAVVELEDHPVKAVGLKECADALVARLEGEGNEGGVHGELGGEGRGVEARVGKEAEELEGGERVLAHADKRAVHLLGDEGDEVEDVREHPLPRHLGEARQVLQEEEEVGEDEAAVPPRVPLAEEERARAEPVEEVADERPAHDLLDIIPERAEELEEVEHLEEDDGEEEELVHPPPQPALRHTLTSPAPAARMFK